MTYTKPYSITYMILSAYNRPMKVICTLVFASKQLHAALAHSKSLPVNPPMVASYSDPDHVRNHI